MPEAAAALGRELGRNRALVERIAADDFDHAGLERLQTFQRWRMSETYKDLYADPHYRRACYFFLERLYGGREFEQRDRQLERVAPVMNRLLSDDMLRVVADAMALQADSLELDIDLAARLAGVDEITQPAYAAAYRAQARWDDRIAQIRAIGRLGRTLDRVVHRSAILRLVRVIRLPARAAGFGALQDFLEEGLRAFRAMRGAEPFIEAIEQREMKALEAMRAGADRPFAEWIGPGSS